MRNVFVAGCPRTGTGFVVKALEVCGWRSSIGGGDDPVVLENREHPGFATVVATVLRANDSMMLGADLAVSVKAGGSGADFLFAGTPQCLVEPWVVKNNGVLAAYPALREVYGYPPLVVTVRRPGPSITSLVKYLAVGELRARKIWTAAMVNALVLYALYPGAVFFVTFPELEGLREFVEAAGGTYDAQGVARLFDGGRVHVGEHATTGVLDDLYAAALGRLGWRRQSAS